MQQKNTAKVMIIMLIVLVVFFGAIILFKTFQSHMMTKFIQSHQNPPVTVSTAKAVYENWQPILTASGSLRAVKGVDVTTEVGGKVTSINFAPGATVKQGDILLKMYVDDEVAQLASLKAQADLAKIVYRRDSAQYAIHAISKATLDSDFANLKSTEAQVLEQAAVIAKKIIRAPFSGKLGVLQVNLGQYLNPGQTIVTLQALNPIWLDFYLPEQVIGQLKLNQYAEFTSDSFPKQKFSGNITTINPKVDPSTRNIEVEATIKNPKNQLLPGMFAEVKVKAGSAKRYITLPQAAISYYPYGDIVFLVNQAGKDQDGKPILSVKQKFITAGEVRGDQVAILKGIKAGDVVVTSGQLKLKNGSRVVINNNVQPQNNQDPIVRDTE